MARGLAGLLLLLLLAACREEQPPAGQPVEAVRLVVVEEGVYRVTAELLREAGLAVDELAVDNLLLTTGNQAVPFRVEGEQLYFYGRGSDSRYTNGRIYILRTGVQGVAMAEELAAPAGPTVESVRRTLRFEENWEYFGDARSDGVAEPWFWHTLPLQGELALPLTAQHPVDGSGELQLVLYGASHHPQEDPDHSLSLTMNGKGEQRISWDGQAVYTATVSLSAGTLAHGDNVLSLTNVPETFLDMMKLDRLELDYAALPITDEDRLAFRGPEGQVTLQGFTGTPLLLNVADPATPTVLVGWEATAEGATLGLNEAWRVAAIGPEGYLQPAALTPLRSGGWVNGRADLLIITTDELAPALAPLVAAREEQGLAVAVVPVAEIYDEFGPGMATPESINRFLAHALDVWTPPAPRYLLLVGDATIDYRGYLAQRPNDPIAPPQNVIPPYLVPVSYGGETVSDSRLADVDGDGKPDLAVGRWPVDDAAAVRDLVERTLAYEAGSAAGRALFVSDASGPEFATMTGRLVAGSALPDDAVERLDGPPNEGLIAAWNAGAWLVTYTGHGSLQLWGKDNILSSEAVSELSPGPAAAPIVLQLTCLTGLFAHPEVTSLSERLLAQEGGPVLTVAATSLTLSSQQEPFAREFLAALLDPEVERIGDALQRAKESLDVDGAALQEISDTFGLLGDPSARIVRP